MLTAIVIALLLLFAIWAISVLLLPISLLAWWTAPTQAQLDAQLAESEALLAEATALQARSARRRA